MATTPLYNLRYLELGDPPDIAGATEHLAEDAETQIARLDAIIAGLSTATDWTDYTPSAQNIGSAVFSTQTGFWRRTWTKDVEYTAYFVVSTNGTGTGTFGYKLPTVPYRGTIRQMVGHGTRGDGTRVARLTAVTFAGGTAEWVDRVLVDYTSAVPTGNVPSYLQGQDLDAGDILVFSGKYREA